MPYTVEEIEDFIELFRESVPNAVEVYTQGNCTSFAMILSEAFHGGTVCHNISHATFEYKGLHYDITGQVEKPKGTMPLTEYSPMEIRSLMKNRYVAKRSDIDTIGSKA